MQKFTAIATLNAGDTWFEVSDKAWSSGDFYVSLTSGATKMSGALSDHLGEESLITARIQ